MTLFCQILTDLQKKLLLQDSLVNLQLNAY